MRKQKKQTKVSIGRLFGVLLIIIGICSLSSAGINVLAISYDTPSYSILTILDPISITSDSDFYAFPGLGTEEDPYVIEGYNITTQDLNGIYVGSTTKYFTIRDCYIESSNSGIYIRNVADGTANIINNTCSKNVGYSGILLYSSSNSTVVDNLCYNNTHGISLDYSANSTITNNMCINNEGIGIFLRFCANSTITNNTCSNNDYGSIVLTSASSIVANNTFTNCGLEISEHTIDAYLSYDVENNWVNRKQIGYLTNLDSSIIAEPIYGQLILINCTNITVRDQELNNATIGLFLYSCSFSTITNNTCNNNSYKGVFLASSSSSTVTNNTCNSNNIQGIHLYYSGSSTVANNTCNNNKRIGIFFQVSENSICSNNSFTNCGFQINEVSLDDYLSNTVEDNLVNGKKLGYYSNLDSTIFADPIYGQLILINCTGVTIRNQIIDYTSNGLSLYNCADSTISNNTCSNDNDYGIYLRNSDKSTVTNNTCNNNLFGIYLSSSNNSNVVNNFCNNNGNGIYLSSSGSSTVTNNSCNNNDRGIYLSSSGSSMVTNNSCNNNDRGIYLYSSGSSAITNNMCSDNYEGIYITYSSNSNVTKNSCINNQWGIQPSASSNFIVSNNTCNYNYYGIGLFSSDNSTVAENMCNYNSRGFYLSSTINSTFFNNTCNYNWFGMYLVTDDSCVFTYNLLQENDDFGIYLRLCSNNSIHHNTFVENNHGEVSQAYDEGTNNTWYDPESEEGNYWSDWSGIGIYAISGSAVTSDLYPLDQPTRYLGPPVITDIVHSPSTPTELDSIEISANVSSLHGVQLVSLYYRVNSGTWIEVSMSLVAADHYSCNIGPFDIGDTIEFYINASDNSTSHGIGINNNSSLYYSFNISDSVVIPEFQSVYPFLFSVSTHLFAILVLMVRHRRKK